MPQPSGEPKYFLPGIKPTNSEELKSLYSKGAGALTMSESPQSGVGGAVYLHLFLTGLLLLLTILSVPGYLTSTRRFYQIFLKGQPFYVLLLLVLLVAALNLLTAVVDGVGLWTPLPYCSVLGVARIALLLLSSLLVALVCTTRCLAVSCIELYKQLNKTCILCGVAAGLLLLSVAISTGLAATGHMTFGYLGPPSHMGCSPLVTPHHHTYITFLVCFLFCCNILLLLLFLLLHKKLRHPSVRPCMRRLKASARRVSLLVTLSYIVLHLPLVLLYTVYSCRPAILREIQHPAAKLLLDFLVRFLSYLYSSLLPAIIVKTGGTDSETMQAAKQSVITGK